jgi:two-component system, sensor histidine kinase and response regulator
MIQIYLKCIIVIFISQMNIILIILASLGILSLIFVIIRFVFNSNRKNNLLRQKNLQLEQMNIQLKKSEQQLKKLNATKARLFSIIAHDLRSAMNAILGFSEIIANKQKTLTESELNKYSNIINQTAHQVYLLRETLLDWSRAQGENIRFNPEVFDLYSTATNVITLLEIKAYQKNVELKSIIPKPCLVKGDKTMVGSVIRNLLDNALKFTPSGGKIEVFAIKDDSVVEVWVSDTGIGMDADELQKLFHGDSHASSEGTDHEKGTGLGLFICRDFVEMHGGKIWAESRKNSGTIFKFNIPSGMI